jgi:PAS domain S-box-containing protein
MSVNDLPRATGLSDTSRRLNAILANTREAVFLMDERQQCIFANAAAEKLTGYAFAEMQGRPLHDVVHHKKPDGSPYPIEECPIDRAFPARAQLSGEELFVARDGSFYPVAFTASPVLDEAGRPIGTVIEARDITEEKARDAALRETEERYRLAARATNDAIWDWRMRDGHVIWNEALQNLFGHDRRESSAAWWIEHIHPDDRARVDASIHRVIDGGGEAWSEEYRFLRADGSYADVFDRGTVLRDEAGQPARMIGAMLDLSQRKATEARLRESEARYRTLFEAIEVGFCIVDLKFDAGGRAVDYRLTEMNPAFEKQTGLYGAAGKWVSEAAPGLERHWFEVYGQVALTGQPTRFENFAEPFGRWYDVYAFPAGKREERRVGILFNDITERKAAEARLRELNESLERRVAEATAERDEIWRTSLDLMLVADFDTTIRAVNPAWTQVLGWSEDELIGRSFMDLIHPEELAASRAEAAQLADEKQATQQFLNRYQRKDGGWAWLSWAVSSAGGRFYGVARDVTAEREQAEALAQAEEALRQSQKMEAVGQLTGGIAHDFNNMLAVTIGSLDLLSRRITDSDPRVKRYIDAAGDGARRAAQLTQRLLAFSRQQPLRPEPVEVNKLVLNMSELLRHSLGGDIRLETVLAGGLWRTHADRNQLESAILNLAVNARDAMSEGGRLTVETANCHLDERYAAGHLGLPAGQYVMIAVSDTGSGMPPDVVAKAFDPFFTTKETGKGTGLGLSQVYGFVKQSGGHVKIYSEPGQGTTVKIYLPRLLGAVRDPEEAEAPGLVPTGDSQELILVVEDEPAVRRFSVDALVELGYRVVEADGATAALRLLDAHPEIALLFTDVVMPDVNGRKLAEEAQRRRLELKVLFTTGYTRNAVVHNGVLDAGVELIGKPFTVEELAAKMRAVLDS